MITLHEALQAYPTLLLDGATGTNLFVMGLESGQAPEFWNIERPDDILKLHQRFIDAGSDLILTNSFGGNARRLMLHKAEDRVHELNKAAAQLARSACNNSDRDVYVLGSVGPTGDLLYPLGALTQEDAEECFYDQAQALIEGGVDGFWIETLSSIEEASGAVHGIQRANDALPIFLSLSFDTAGNTMMGIAPENLGELLKANNLDVTGYGANCGLGPAELLDTMIAMREKMPYGQKDNTYLLAKSNYGIPEFRGGKFHYHGTPEMMAQYAQYCVDLEVKIVGGCCGTEPEAISVMREAIDTHEKAKLNSDKILEIKEFIAKNAAAQSPSPAPKSPNDRSASDRRSAGRSRSRRRH